jgi:hypothetical protein
VFVGLASAIGLALPRSLASSVAARSSQSSSWSFRYRMAFGKSFGRTVRRGGRPVTASAGLSDEGPPSLSVAGDFPACPFCRRPQISAARGSERCLSRQALRRSRRPYVERMSLNCRNSVVVADGTCGCRPRLPSSLQSTANPEETSIYRRIRPDKTQTYFDKYGLQVCPSGRAKSGILAQKAGAECAKP